MLSVELGETGWIVKSYSANPDWLLNHHRAKIPERTAFAKRLAKLHPKKIVDLGCATGLWLELLNGIMPLDCEFIGIDSDIQSLEIANSRSKSWSRKTAFLRLDIEKDVTSIPSADMILASYFLTLPNTRRRI